MISVDERPTVFPVIYLNKEIKEIILKKYLSFKNI